MEGPESNTKHRPSQTHGSTEAIWKSTVPLGNSVEHCPYSQFKKKKSFFFPKISPWYFANERNNWFSILSATCNVSQCPKKNGTSLCTPERCNAVNPISPLSFPSTIVEKSELYWQWLGSVFNSYLLMHIKIEFCFLPSNIACQV